MGEYSALKDAIDVSMKKIKDAKKAIKDAINTAGEPMDVSVDETDTFRSYADAIRNMYQRIWSSDDGTDAPAKCIITNDDFPNVPMHNYGYIDINDLSADRFGDDKKYYAASSFIVDIQNPPVPIGSEDNYFVGKITSISHGTEPEGLYTGPTPPDDYGGITGYNSKMPRYAVDTEIGKYVIFCTDCYNGSGNFMTFPGGLFYSYTRSYEMNTIITISAYGKEETFTYLGRWNHHNDENVWQRLTGGD